MEGTITIIILILFICLCSINYFQNPNCLNEHLSFQIHDFNWYRVVIDEVHELGIIDKLRVSYNFIKNKILTNRNRRDI